MKRPNSLMTWLNKPFPFYETNKQKVITPLLFALFIMFFLVLFNPSGNTDFVFTQFLKVFAYGFITFSVLIVYNMFIPFLFPKLFDVEKWNVKKSIIFTTLSIVSIGIVNGLFAFKLDNPNNNSHVIQFLISVMLKTFTIGFLPVIIYVFYREKKLYKQYSLKALAMIEDLKKSKGNEEKINTSSYLMIDNMEIAYADLFCVKSIGNYCMFFYNKNNKLEKKMIRSSLNKIEQEINKSEKIIRCHKSYMVNLEKVNNMEGNARGYSFFIKELEFIVPGSRNLSKELIKEIRNN